MSSRFISASARLRRRPSHARAALSFLIISIFTASFTLPLITQRPSADAHDFPPAAERSWAAGGQQLLQKMQQLPPDVTRALVAAPIATALAMPILTPSPTPTLTPAPMLRRVPKPHPKPAATITHGGSGWHADYNVSFYGPGFYGHRTACGLKLTTTLIGVANRTLPCGTMVTFRNPANGRTVTAPVVDRGPYVSGRYWDLTGGLCTALGMCHTGTLQWHLH
jgi:hypothetical protein